MAPTISTIFLYFTGFWFIECSFGLEVRLESSDQNSQKFVGDSLILTCTAYNRKEDDPRVKYMWILPINKQDSVKEEYTSGGSTLTISHLEETDGGLYTCQAADIADGMVKSKDSVEIVVFPRGRASHCSGNYFRCNSGQCISNRYKCDGHMDCPHDGSDEAPEHCGHDPCAGKLACSDGRCLSRNLCCIEPDLSHPNCTITASILCCRQLIHPALLDQDLYYIEMRPKLEHQRTLQPDSTLVMGCIVAVANLVTVAIIVGVRYHLWRSNNNNSPSGAHYHLSRLRSATLRPFGLGSSLSPPSTTDQYQLRSADSSCPRRIPGLRSDLLAPEILHEQRQNQRPYSGVILCPPSHSQPPQYSQLHTPPQGPPPSYNQVVGAPPPPYCSRDDLTTGNVNEGSSLSLLAPLLSHHHHHNNNNNNNGDINGNSTLQLTVEHNHNLSQPIPSTSMPLNPTAPHARRNK